MENDSKQIKNKMYDIFFIKQEKHKGFICDWLMSSRKREFTYLGLKIDVAGSLSASGTMLSSKANKAKFALNNIEKLKQIPVRTAIYVFGAAVLPILTYGSEIWALNATLHHDKWDKTSTEQAHLSNTFLELIDQPTT